LAADLQVWLAEEGGDSYRLDAMAAGLRNELLDLDVVRVCASDAGRATNWRKGC
jgi:hypothetical protein